MRCLRTVNHSKQQNVGNDTACGRETDLVYKVEVEGKDQDYLAYVPLCTEHNEGMNPSWRELR